MDNDAWNDLRKEFAEAKKEWQTEHDRVWKSLPESTRLACADVIFRAIDAHAKEGGSYRHLIYDRLGFGVGGAYSVLQCAGALDVSNLYDLSGNKSNDDETDS